ncbi:hypothetical protein KTN05_12155 [Paracoccus sp. Z118]|uniref:hypothetical protein n=1 Tax=Paracoccus sp. Z118 TaxID=2851017 RepID=UPI001C2BC471|nr:hypothetical protein [Paracoccus sp. Z118]MBV0892603.1 hypothetical protein [Paracoccus sp. Z118]
MLSRLRDIFRSDDFIPTSSVFPGIDADKIAAEMKLAEKGRARGAQNQPPTDMTEFDHVEASIIQRIEESRRKGLENYEINRRVYNERLTRAGHASEEVNIEAGKAMNAFNATVHSHRNSIVDARERLNETYRWRNLFRERHRLSRPAQEFNGWINVISVSLVLVAVEAGMNSYLFSSGNEFGLLGGLLVAVIVSATNVGMSLFLGHLANSVNHRNPLRKLIGAVFFLGWVALALAINFGVAHFRDGLERGLEWRQAAEQAVPSMIANPFGLATIESWLLVILGCMISSFAYLKGWHADDPYPGYGRLSRSLSQARAEYDAQFDDVLHQLVTHRDEAIAGLQAANEDVRDAITEAIDALFGQSSLSAHLQTFLEQCDLATAYLLARYRDENRAARETPAPATFGKAYRFPEFKPESIDTSRKEMAESEARKVNETVQTTIKAIFGQFESARKEFSVTDDVELGGAKPAPVQPVAAQPALMGAQ